MIYTYIQSPIPHPTSSQWGDGYGRSVRGVHPSFPIYSPPAKKQFHALVMACGNICFKHLNYPISLHDVPRGLICGHETVVVDRPFMACFSCRTKYDINISQIASSVHLFPHKIWMRTSIMTKTIFSLLLKEQR